MSTLWKSRKSLIKYKNKKHMELSRVFFFSYVELVFDAKNQFYKTP